MRATAKLKRRGTVYVAVAGVTMVVAVMAAAGMMLARIELRLNETQCQQAEARALAQTAIEYSTNWLDRNTSWRSYLVHNVESPQMALGRGTFTVKLVDLDGQLNNDDTDPIYVVGTGRVGEAVAVEFVELEPIGQGLTCLESALHAQDDVRLEAGSILARNDLETNQTISSNDDIDASAYYTKIKGDAWAVDNVSGSVTGAQHAHQSPPREMPNTHVFDYYLKNGSWIEISDLPVGIGCRIIQNKVLSPGHNPFGAVNPQGIYVIDCEGAEVKVSGSRIVGTLILLNNANSSSVSGAVNWEPAAANYPALLAQNNFELRHSGGTLSELLQLTNFNPSHTPYQNNSDSDALDTYPSLIRGLIYVGGELLINGSTPKTNGAIVVGGRVSVASSAELNFNSIHFDNPPPGFSTGNQMRIIPGTWQSISAE